LCGVSGGDVVNPALVLDLILQTNADVVCLQEATADASPYTDPAFEAA
jgi:hypothetical protein